MKNLILSGVLLLLCFCGVEGQSNKNSHNQQITLWKEYVSREAGFKISFPGDPQFSNEIVTETPIKRINYRFEVSLREGYFAVHYSDHPLLPEFENKNLKANYESLKNLTARLVKAQIINEKEVSVDDNPGLEVTYKLNDEAIIDRFYLVNKRLYQNIVAISYADLENELVKEKIRMFFDSFAIVEKVNK